MRIIRILVALALLGAILAPLSSLAAQTEPSNETQINLKINGDIAFFEGVPDSGFKPLNLEPSSLSSYDPDQIQEQDEREAKLARFKNKLDNAIFPEGKFQANVSAYTAAADECGKSDGITASGLKVKENRTLACPSAFPFGTKIRIEGAGTYVCEDRGGAIKGNKFDIYMKTKKQAFSFGRKKLLAEVIK